MASLTTEQKALIKAYVEANPELYGSIPHTHDGAYDLNDKLSLVADPAFIVWKTSVDPDEIMRNGMDWARVDNLTAGKARIWEWMTKLGSFNASKANVRAGIDATWVGTAADLAVRAQVYSHCKRPATIIEKILATGTGTDASPAIMGYEGKPYYLEIYTAVGWNNG